VARTSQDDVTGGHLDVPATCSGDVSEERIIAVGSMRHIHHIRALTSPDSRRNVSDPAKHALFTDDFDDDVGEYVEEPYTAL
jgi:hypothetical protein